MYHKLNNHDTIKLMHVRSTMAVCIIVVIDDICYTLLRYLDLQLLHLKNIVYEYRTILLKNNVH